MRWVALALLGSLAVPAHAQNAAVNTSAPRVHVESEGDCPTAAKLEAALEPLLGPGRVAFDGEALAPDASEPVQALVSDLGDRYVIAIRGLRRELEDRKHDCADRARVAAVLIALNLGESEKKPQTDAPPDALPPVRPTEVKAKPPSQARRETKQTSEAKAPDEDEDEDEDADEREEEPEEEEPEVIEPPEPPEPFTIGMQLLGSGELATAIGHGAFGGSVGVWVRDAGFGVALDAGLLSPVTLTLEPRAATRARAALMRIPITFSVHYLFGPRAIRVGPALGMAVDVLRVAGEDVDRAQTAVRASFGGFLGLDAHARLGPELEAVIRLHLRAFPKAYSLALPPEGAVGETPKLWVGASLGLGWRLR